MYFSSVYDLLTMDGDGLFVWLAYAVFFVIALGLFFVPWRDYRKTLQQLRSMQQFKQTESPTQTRQQ